MKYAKHVKQLIASVLILTALLGGWSRRDRNELFFVGWLLILSSRIDEKADAKPGSDNE